MMKFSLSLRLPSYSRTFLVNINSLSLQTPTFHPKAFRTFSSNKELDEKIKFFKYNPVYIQEVVLKEFKNYIAQRNKELRFIPNELNLNNNNETHSHSENIVKLFGEYSPSQDTSYWSKLSLDTTFDKLYLIKPEIEIIIYNICKKLEIDAAKANELRNDQGIQNDGSIKAVISSIEKVLKCFQ